MLAYGFSAYIHYVLSCVCLCISNSRRLLYVRTCLQVPVCVTVTVHSAQCAQHSATVNLYGCMYVRTYLYSCTNPYMLVSW